MSSSDLPPRVERLRVDLVALMIETGGAGAGDAAAELQAMPLPELLVRWLNWTRRFIPPRPRRVAFAHGFWNHRALLHRARLQPLIHKIQTGADLATHHSPQPFRASYRMKAKPGERINRWHDKDFALNAFDLHHLHLVEMDARGRRSGSKELLFLKVYRDSALLMFVGDHNSFHDGAASRAGARVRALEGRQLRGIVPRQQTSSDDADRTKLAVHGFSTAVVHDGKVFVDAAISTDGTSTATVQHARRILANLRQVEDALDDGSWVSQVFPDGSWKPPASPIYRWFIEFGDLVLLEESTRAKVVLVQGYC